MPGPRFNPRPRAQGDGSVPNRTVSLDNSEQQSAVSFGDTPVQIPPFIKGGAGGFMMHGWP